MHECGLHSLENVIMIVCVLTIYEVVILSLEQGAMEIWFADVPWNSLLNALNLSLSELVYIFSYLTILCRHSSIATTCSPIFL